MSAEVETCAGCTNVTDSGRSLHFPAGCFDVYDGHFDLYGTADTLTMTF